MPYDFDLDDYVLQQLDKQSHKEHDYNADTLLAGKKLEDYLQLFHFIKCR
jgi:hypothetical protein